MILWVVKKMYTLSTKNSGANIFGENIFGEKNFGDFLRISV